MVFQCVGRASMVLRISCHRQVYKLPVGLVPEALEEKPDVLGVSAPSFNLLLDLVTGCSVAIFKMNRRLGVISDKLQTCLMFESKSAKVRKDCVSSHRLFSVKRVIPMH